MAVDIRSMQGVYQQGVEQFPGGFHVHAHDPGGVVGRKIERTLAGGWILEHQIVNDLRGALIHRFGAGFRFRFELITAINVLFQKR